ncbi:MAG: bifunctional phosphoribosyl-AMP cyclohydrolase/phosphoribosyl-ATP diphosphatase HisIE [Lachnospiraceae bacterium]|nr:bifunctional phosphoribosyl-AMP cyclohydrolase/phosphoribosyl-ATP diphosphatase HisIE [Lachnospiraceae bacterium]MDY4968800.1 bifunctional phosphoribosyl-AMP cyclohydrolase/phosphoribosyl-ATP diphosphatase HisIE [Lachnospiraceae bacterium]
MKKVIPYILLKDGVAYLAEGTRIQDAAAYCQACAGSGADSLLFMDASETEEEHHKNMELLKQLSAGELGIFQAGGTCSHIDDVKKYLYTGAQGMVFAPGASEELMKEGLSRFKADRAGIQVDSLEEAVKACELGFRIFYCFNQAGGQIAAALMTKAGELGVKQEDLSVYCMAEEGLFALEQGAAGLLYSVPENQAGKIMDYKHRLLQAGYEADVFRPVFTWEDFKLNGDGMMPVVVQDWKNDEVLMVAYMNREAYEMTVKTGRMTYFSRSRQSLWIKGETSGHYQYVKSLKIDCDQDTLLARVVQVGAACHTGNRSCFYRDIVNRETESSNPNKVLENVYNTIMDRKLHPREGSYTNYLFQKGLDKILKKVGEEATEIVIAAKNPEPQEIVYELGDFLYHVMVLMADKGITWEDVARELADRE